MITHYGEKVMCECAIAQLDAVLRVLYGCFFSWKAEYLLFITVAYYYFQYGDGGLEQLI
jgi:hypothetical protein